jgi:hypothetical protein
MRSFMRIGRSLHLLT